MLTLKIVGSDKTVKAEYKGADLAAVVIREHKRVDQHAHPQTDSGVPDSAEGIGKRFDIRCGTDCHNDQAGKGRGEADSKSVVKRDNENNARTRGSQPGNRQRQQNNSRNRACNNSQDLCYA